MPDAVGEGLTNRRRHGLRSCWRPDEFNLDGQHFGDGVQGRANQDIWDKSHAIHMYPFIGEGGFPRPTIFRVIALAGDYVMINAGLE